MSISEFSKIMKNLYNSNTLPLQNNSMMVLPDVSNDKSVFVSLVCLKVCACVHL